MTGVRAELASDGATVRLVVDEPFVLVELCAVIERLNRGRLHNGQLPFEYASEFVAPARDALSLLRTVAQTQPLDAATRHPAESWVTTEEAARHLGVTPQAITKRARAGTIRSRKSAGIWWIDIKEIEHGRRNR